MIQESIDKFIDDTDCPARSDIGLLSAVVNFQRIKIKMQNKILAAKNQLDDKIKTLVAKIITNHKSYLE
jgi:hypothetical protein